MFCLISLKMFFFLVLNGNIRSDFLFVFSLFGVKVLIFFKFGVSGFFSRVTKKCVWSFFERFWVVKMVPWVFGSSCVNYSRGWYERQIRWVGVWLVGFYIRDLKCLIKHEILMGKYDNNLKSLSTNVGELDLILPNL